MQKCDVLYGTTVNGRSRQRRIRSFLKVALLRCNCSENKLMSGGPALTDLAYLPLSERDTTHRPQPECQGPLVLLQV